MISYLYLYIYIHREIQLASIGSSGELVHPGLGYIDLYLSLGMDGCGEPPGGEFSKPTVGPPRLVVCCSCSVFVVFFFCFFCFGWGVSEVLDFS